MMRLAIKRFLVFVGILTGLVMGCQLACFGYLALVKPWKVGLIMVDSCVSAETWLDSNGNGYREYDEPPMEGVCVWDALTLDVPDNEEMAQICENPFFRTGESGEWPDPEEMYLTFRAGASCEDIYIFVKPPQGYRATTPVIANACRAEFGFAPESSAPQGSRFSYTDYVQRKEARERYQQIGITLGGLAAVVFSAAVSIKLVRPREPLSVIRATRAGRGGRGGER